MKKSELLSLINKYYLNKITESVTIRVEKNRSINIDFISNNSDLIGNIHLASGSLDPGEISIYNTTSFLKFISILDENFSSYIQVVNKISSKLMLKDSSYELFYPLSDPNIINQVPEVNEPESYDLVVDFNDEFTNKFIKVKNAFTECKEFSIESVIDSFTNTNNLLFTIGESGNHSNKISFELKTEETNLLNNMRFSFDNMREILVANKEIQNGRLYIYNEGLMKIEFTDSSIQTKYFLVKLD